MVDLSDVMGATPLYTSIQKKRDKVKERLDKHNAKIAEWLEAKRVVTKPLEDEVAMYSEMLAAMDKKNGADMLQAAQEQHMEAGDTDHAADQA